MNELGATGGYCARGPWSSTPNITVLSFMAIPGFTALHSIRRADTQDFHYGTRKQAQEGHEARPKSSSSLLSFPQAVSALEGGAERSAGRRVDTTVSQVALCPPSQQSRSPPAWRPLVVPLRTYHKCLRSKHTLGPQGTGALNSSPFLFVTIFRKI